MTAGAEAQAELNVILRFLDAGMARGVGGVNAALREQMGALADASSGVAAYTQRLSLAERAQSLLSRTTGMLTGAVRAGISGLSGMTGGILALSVAMKGADSILHAFEESMLRQGINGKQMLAQLTKDSKGLVDQKNIMEKVNTAISFMGKESLEKYVEVGKRASDMTGVFSKMLTGSMALARSTGMEVNQVFSNMLLGAARYDTQMLRTIGIQTSMEEAMSKWAAKTGNAADTAQNKMMAFLDIVIEKGDEAVVNFGISTGGIGTQIARLKTSFSNLALSATSSFDKGMTRPILRAAADFVSFLEGQLTPAMERAGKLLERIPEPLMVFVGGLLSLRSIVGVLVPLMGTFGASLPIVGTALGLLGGPLGVVLMAVLALFSALRSNEAFGLWFDNTGATVKVTNALADATTYLSGVVTALAEPFRGVSLELGIWAEQMGNVIEGLLEGDFAGAAADWGDQAEMLGATLFAVADNVQRSWGPTIASALDYVSEQFELFINGQGVIWDAWEGFLEKAGVDVDGLPGDVSRALEATITVITDFTLGALDVVIDWGVRLIENIIATMVSAGPGVRDSVAGWSEQIGYGIGRVGQALLGGLLDIGLKIAEAAKVWGSALGGFTRDQATWSRALDGAVALVGYLTLILADLIGTAAIALGKAFAAGFWDGLSDEFLDSDPRDTFAKIIFPWTWFEDEGEKGGQAAATAAGMAGAQAMTGIEQVLANGASMVMSRMTALRLQLWEEVNLAEYGVNNMVLSAPSPLMTGQREKAIAAAKAKEKKPAPGGGGGGGDLGEEGKKGKKPKEPREKDPVAEAYQAISGIASALSAGIDAINKLWKEWRGAPPDELFDEVFDVLGTIVDRMIDFTGSIGGGERAEEASAAAGAISAFVGVLTGVVDLAAGLVRMRTPTPERLQAVFDIATQIGEFGMDWSAGLIGGDLEGAVKAIRLATDAAGILSAWADAMLKVAESAKALQGRRLEVNWDRVRAFSTNALQMGLDLSTSVVAKGGFVPRVLLDATDTLVFLKTVLEAVAAIAPATDSIARARFPTDLKRPQEFLQAVLQLASEITTGLATAKGYDLLVHLEDMQLTIDALGKWLDAVGKVGEITQGLAMARFDVDLTSAMEMIEDILWFASTLTEALRQSRALPGGGTDLNDHLDEMGLTGTSMAPWLEALVKLGEIAPILEHLTVRRGHLDVDGAAQLLEDIGALAWRLTAMARGKSGRLDLVAQEDIGLVAGSLLAWLDVLRGVGEALGGVRAVAAHLSWAGQIDLSATEKFLVDLGGMAGRIWSASKDALGGTRLKDWQESGLVAGAIKAWIDLLGTVGDALEGVRSGVGARVKPADVRAVMDVLLTIAEEAWVRFGAAIGQTGGGTNQAGSRDVAESLLNWLELIGRAGAAMAGLRAGAAVGVQTRDIQVILDVLLTIAVEAWGRFGAIVRGSGEGQAGASAAVAGSLLAWLDLIGKAAEAMAMIRVGALQGTSAADVTRLLDILVAVAEGAWVRFGSQITAAGAVPRQAESKAVAESLLAWLSLLGKAAEAMAGIKLAGVQKVTAADVAGLLDTIEVVYRAAMERFGMDAQAANTGQVQAGLQAVTATLGHMLEVVAKSAEALRAIRTTGAHAVSKEDVERVLDVIELVYRKTVERFGMDAQAANTGQVQAGLQAVVTTLGGMVQLVSGFGGLVLSMRTARLAEGGDIEAQLSDFFGLLWRMWEFMRDFVAGRGGEATYNAMLGSSKLAAEALGAVAGLFAAMGGVTRSAALADELPEATWTGIENTLSRLGDLLVTIGDRFKNVGQGDPDGYLGTAKTAIEALGSLFSVLADVGGKGKEIARFLAPSAAEWSSVEAALGQVVAIFARLMNNPTLGVPLLGVLAEEWAKRWGLVASSLSASVGAISAVSKLNLLGMIEPTEAEWEAIERVIGALWAHWQAIADKLMPGGGARGVSDAKDLADRLASFGSILTAAAGAINVIAGAGLQRAQVVAMDEEVLTLVEHQAEALIGLLTRLEARWGAGRRDPERDRDMLTGYADLLGKASGGLGAVFAAMTSLAGMSAPSALPDIGQVAEWGDQVLALMEKLSGRGRTAPVGSTDLERVRQEQERTWAHVKAYIDVVTAGAGAITDLVAAMKTLRDEQFNLGELSPLIASQLRIFVTDAMNFWKGLGTAMQGLNAEGLLVWGRVAAYAKTAGEIVGALQPVVASMTALLGLKWVETKVSETQTHRELRDLELGADFMAAVERGAVAMLTAMQNIATGQLPALLNATDPDRIDVLLAQLASRAGKMGEVADAVGKLVGPILAWFGESGSGGNPLLVSKDGSNWMTRVRNIRADYYAEQLAKAIERTVKALTEGTNAAFQRYTLDAGTPERAKALFDSVESIAGALARVMQMPAYNVDQKGPGTVVEQARILAEGATILATALAGFTIPDGVEEAAKRMENAVISIGRAISVAMLQGEIDLERIRLFVEAARLLAGVDMGQAGRGQGSPRGEAGRGSGYAGGLNWSLPPDNRYDPQMYPGGPMPDVYPRGMPDYIRTGPQGGGPGADGPLADPEWLRALKERMMATMDPQMYPGGPMPDWTTSPSEPLIDPEWLRALKERMLATMDPQMYPGGPMPDWTGGGGEAGMGTGSRSWGGGFMGGAGDSHGGVIKFGLPGGGSGDSPPGMGGGGVMGAHPPLIDPEWLRALKERMLATMDPQMYPGGPMPDWATSPSEPLIDPEWLRALKERMMATMDPQMYPGGPMPDWAGGGGEAGMGTGSRSLGGGGGDNPWDIFVIGSDALKAATDIFVIGSDALKAATDIFIIGSDALKAIIDEASGGSGTEDSHGGVIKFGLPGGGSGTEDSHGGVIKFGLPGGTPDGGPISLPPVVIEMPTIAVTIQNQVDARLMFGVSEIARALQFMDEQRHLVTPSAPSPS